MSGGRTWWVYLLRCADGTLYVGMTDDVDRRAAVHNSGRGAKYTRGRRPVEPVYRERCESRSAALKREAALKKLSRRAKLALVAAQTEEEREPMEQRRPAGWACGWTAPAEAGAPAANAG